MTVSASVPRRAARKTAGPVRAATRRLSASRCELLQLAEAVVSPLAALRDASAPLLLLLSCRSGSRPRGPPDTRHSKRRSGELIDREHFIRSA